MEARDAEERSHYATTYPSGTSATMCHRDWQGRGRTATVAFTPFYFNGGGVSGSSSSAADAMLPLRELGFEL